MKQRLVNLALLAGVSGVLLVAFELVGRYTFFRDRLDMVHDVDHRPKPEWPGFNADGIRSDREADAFSPEAFNIVLLGDSYVMGLYILENAHTIAGQLETIIRRRRPGANVNVLNFGWISASPLLSLRQLRDIGEKYHPDLVVSCIDMTDFQDDLKYERFLDRGGIYALATAAPVTFLSTRKLMSMIPPLNGAHRLIFGFPAKRFFPVHAPLAETEPWLEVLGANLDATAEEAGALGASYAVCVFPRSFQYSERECPDNWEAGEYEILGPHAHEPFAYFDRVRERVAYPVYSLLPDFLATPVFPTCFDGDPHWTPPGVGVAARALYHYLSRDGLLDPVGAEQD